MGGGKSGPGGREQSVTRGDGKTGREEERGRAGEAGEGEREEEEEGGLSSGSGHCSDGLRSMNCDF